MPKTSQSLADVVLPSSTPLFVPAGVNEMDAQYLWENVYKDTGHYNSAQDMVSEMGIDGLQREMGVILDPAAAQAKAEAAETLDGAIPQIQDALASRSRKFNLKSTYSKKDGSVVTKKSQFETGDDFALTDAPIDAPDQLQGEYEGYSYDDGRIFSGSVDFYLWLDKEVSQEGAFEYLTSRGTAGDDLRESLEIFYTASDADAIREN